MTKVPSLDDSPPVHTSKKLWLSVALNVLLVLALGAMGLYAFMIKVDMEEQKGLLIRNASDRQQLETYLAQTRNELAAARNEAEDLRARLNAQALGDQISDVAKPALPIEVGFRRSFWGRGLVAKFRNKSDHSLTLILAIRNPTLSKSNRFQLRIGPEDTAEFSYSDGWEFSSGDELAIYHNDFKGLKVVVP
ncbi:MAG: hypothetical protein WBX11_00650 [Thiobacillaceae bacterium]